MVCDSLTINGQTCVRHILPAYFRLLYGCGLREMEALSLTCRDVKIHEKLIHIQKAKNGEDRLLPISSSLAKVLMKYARQYGKDNDTDALFFCRRDDTPCSVHTVYKIFREILFKANIPHGGKACGPRIHDFRHAFAVHSMAAMSDAGLDLYFSLPILSKYLGHKSLDATEKYVRLTAEMYPSIYAEVNKICSYVFPEVYDYETN